jgi:hypothetical protein
MVLNEWGKKQIDDAIKSFRSLDASNPTNCDTYFEDYGIGNRVDEIESPWERFFFYESLLSALRKEDEEKYLTIHKGNPYYFLAWLAWDMRNFDKALFYMDAAISEDVRKDSSGWINSPAGKFLLLEDPALQVAKRCMHELIKCVKDELKRFENNNNGSFSFDFFRKYFIEEFLRIPENRPILSAYYVFLLERKERVFELEHRSSEGGTISPILLSLFKGALIWETILKINYPIRNDNGNDVRTIGDVTRFTTFLSDFGINGVNGTANSLSEVITTAKAIANGDVEVVTRVFETTAKIRNTSGHKITWNDEFGNVDNFITLHEFISDAILYVIHKKYIDGKPPLPSQPTLTPSLGSSVTMTDVATTEAVDYSTDSGVVDPRIDNQGSQ